MKNSEHSKSFTRRSFVKTSVLAGATIPIAFNLPHFSKAQPAQEDELQVSIFSKHLQFLNYKDLAAAVSDLGFDGVELSVREGGHVEPESVKNDLPRAIAAIRERGLSAEMMVSGIRELNPVNQAVLETAAAQGITHYRLAYFRFPESGSMVEFLENLSKTTLKEIGALNKKLGLMGSHQNHSGRGVGSNPWEIWKLLEHTLEGMGCQFDIRHATVEGGRNWSNGLRLLKDNIKTIVLKDFRWEKVDGNWTVFDTPLGEGMVDFPAYFKLLKEYKINVPVSIHYEYDLFGAEHGDRDIPIENHQKIYAAMEKDLMQVRKWWKEA